MSVTLAINLSGPLMSVKVLDNCGEGPRAGSGPVSTGHSHGNAGSLSGTAAPESEFVQASRTLKSLVAAFTEFQEQAIARHREEIAKLAVEIARKILVQKVSDGDYEIEAIVQDALKNVGTHRDVSVHLNPKDIARYQKLQEDGAESAPAGIKLVADASIGPAQCRIESPKGIVESFIEDNLEQIGKALVRAK